MSHEVHNTELVKTVEAELPPWQEYIAIGLEGECWTSTVPAATVEEAIRRSVGMAIDHITIHHIPNPRKPQPAPKIVIDWEAIAKELWSVSHDVRKAVERHARIEVTP